MWIEPEPDRLRQSHRTKTISGQEFSNPKLGCFCGSCSVLRKFTKPSSVRLPTTSWGRLAEKPHLQNPCFLGDPTTEMSDLGLSDSQWHLREPVNLQSQLRPRGSEFHVPRNTETGHK